MAVDTLANFIAAVNAATSKSGAAYNVPAPAPASDGTLTINKGGVQFYSKIFYSKQPVNSVATDANPNGTQVTIFNEGTSPVVMDAQAFITQLGNIG